MLSHNPRILVFTIDDRFYSYNCSDSSFNARGSNAFIRLPTGVTNFTNIIALKITSDADKIIVSNTHYVYIYKWNNASWTSIRVLDFNVTFNYGSTNNILMVRPTVFSFTTVASGSMTILSGSNLIVSNGLISASYGTNNVSVGNTPGWTSGARNVNLGIASQGSVTTTSDNVSVGYGALKGGTANTSVGSYSSNTATGTGNTIMGYFASSNSNDVSNYKVAIGYEAMYNVSASGDNNSVAIGYRAGFTDQSYSSVAIGLEAGNYNQNNNSVAIGNYAGQQQQNYKSVAIGFLAGHDNQNNNSVAIGYAAGKSLQSNNSVAIGSYAGSNVQDINSVAIGFKAGNYDQNASSVAIGNKAGYYIQNLQSIAIGNYAASNFQGRNSIAIGYEAGREMQAIESVAIGFKAGYNILTENAFILNATDSPLDTTTVGVFIKPISTTLDTYSNAPNKYRIYWDSATGKIFGSNE